MSDSLKEIPIKVEQTPPNGKKPGDEETISLYAASKKIYPRSVKGLFNNLRLAVVLLSQIVFLGPATAELEWPSGSTV
nr:hypothetical protein [Paludibacterium denitrificans]